MAEREKGEEGSDGGRERRKAEEREKRGEERKGDLAGCQETERQKTSIDKYTITLYYFYRAYFNKCIDDNNYSTIKHDISYNHFECFLYLANCKTADFEGKERQ